MSQLEIGIFFEVFPVFCLAEFGPFLIELSETLIFTAKAKVATSEWIEEFVTEKSWNKSKPVICLLRSPVLWTNTRMYLVNMAVSDIIMCLTAVPLTPYTAFTGKWIFGQSFCYIFPLIQVKCQPNINRVGKSWYPRYPGYRGTFSKLPVLRNILSKFN